MICSFSFPVILKQIRQSVMTYSTTNRNSPAHIDGDLAIEWVQYWDCKCVRSVYTYMCAAVSVQPDQDTEIKSQAINVSVIRAQTSIYTSD